MSAHVVFIPKVFFYGKYQQLCSFAFSANFHSKPTHMNSRTLSILFIFHFAMRIVIIEIITVEASVSCACRSQFLTLNVFKEILSQVFMQIRFYPRRNETTRQFYIFFASISIYTLSQFDFHSKERTYVQTKRERETKHRVLDGAAMMMIFSCRVHIWRAQSERYDEWQSSQHQQREERRI